MPGEKTDATAPAINIPIEINRIGLRPYLSLSGPIRIWPAPSPAMPEVSPNCTVDAEHPKNRAISGNVGIYISLTNDPKALSATR
jgi:hypothetical protein